MDVKVIPGRFGSTGECESHQDVPISWEQLLLSLHCPHSQAFPSLGCQAQLGKGKTGSREKLMDRLSCCQQFPAGKIHPSAQHEERSHQQLELPAVEHIWHQGRGDIPVQENSWNYPDFQEKARVWGIELQ